MRVTRFNPALPLLAALVACAGTASTTPRDGSSAAGATAAGLHAPKGFAVETIAGVAGARELAALPNGDLLVATVNGDVYIVADAEGKPAAPQVFATLGDQPAAGIAYSAARSEIYVATSHRRCAPRPGGARNGRRHSRDRLRRIHRWTRLRRGGIVVQRDDG